MSNCEFSPSAHGRALKMKLAGIRGKLAVVKRQIAEIQAQQKQPTDNPGLFEHQAHPHPGLRALQDRKRQLEGVAELLKEELWGK
jgi:hypothetical protein